MKLSQRLEYACRAAVQLATIYDGERVCRIEDLSEREAVPCAFLARILNDLRRSGIVVSRRGKTGGYALARDPGSITLAELTEAVEGDFLSLGDSLAGECGSSVRSAWAEVGDQLQVHLKSITLADMAGKVSGIDFSI